HEDYEFYRGENLYVQFKIKEINTGTIITSDIVTLAKLVSAPGGEADLSKIGITNNYYRYKLTPIPPTHDFLGNSQIFAFAFNFSDGSGGEEEVGLTILNNLPVIKPIEDITLYEGESITLNLAQYESDVEDSGNNLHWQTSYASDRFSATLSGKTVTVVGLQEGAGSLTLKLFDLDNDFATKTITVHVLKQQEENHPPVVDIIKPANGAVFYVGDVIIFEGAAIDSEDGVLVPSWSSSKDGNLGTGNTLAKTLSKGTHVITLKATDSEGLVGTDTITVSVVDAPVGLTAEIGGPYTGKVNQSIAFDASASTGSIEYYIFDFGDGTVIQQTSPLISHVYAAAKIYTVTLKVKGNGQEAVDSTIAKVYAFTEPEEPEDKMTESLYVGRIDVYGLKSKKDYTVASDDELIVSVNLENQGETDLRYLKVTVMIPELGIKQKSSIFSLDDDERTTKIVKIPLYDAPAGEYYAKIIVNNAATTRVKYRYVIVE
ncbi:PKD domain-containing protein, partial [Candidatus Woesearchaeota archaeon]